MKHLDRLSYWANRGEDWQSMAWNYGLAVHRQDDRTHLICDQDDRVIALMRRSLDEYALFVFKPEARTPRWMRLRWRLTHPLTALKPDPRISLDAE